MPSLQPERKELRPWRIDTIGRFRVVRRLSSTPYADTLLVLDGDRQRILRWLSPWVSDDVTFFNYFVEMSSSFVEFEHPNVVHIHEHGEAGGRLYVLTERLAGTTLVKVASDGITPLPLPAVLVILRDVLRGLDFVHHAMNVDGQPLNLVYRHVIAGRILLSLDGDVVLREPGPGHSDWQRSRDYLVIHQDSVRNLSPEDLQRRDLDPRGDLYTLACLAIDLCIAEAANPRLSYTSGDQKLLATHEDTMQALDVFEGEYRVLLPIIRRALEIDPGERFSSAATMFRALDPFVTPESVAEGRSWLAEKARQYSDEDKWALVPPDASASSNGATHGIQRRDEEAAKTPIPENLPRRSDPGADTETVDIPMRYVLGEFGHGTLMRRDEGAVSAADDSDNISLDAPLPTAAQRRRRHNRTRNTPGPASDGSSLRDAEASNAGARHTPKAADGNSRYLPDPRVQSVAHLIKAIATLPEASAVTRAAQQRLSGTPRDALDTLEAALSHGDHRVALAAQLERGLSSVETHQPENAIASLRSSIESIDNKADIALCRYYLVLAYLQADRGSEAASMARILLDDPYVRFPGLEDLYAEALRAMGRSRTSGR